MLILMPFFVCEMINGNNFKQGSGRDDAMPDTYYYQWVQFMFFIHGLIFIIPRTVWRSVEGGFISQVWQLTHFYQPRSG